MTMRGGEDRSVRKSFDTFTPFGPTIVTPDALPPITELQLRLRVNGRSGSGRTWRISSGASLS